MMDLSRMQIVIGDACIERLKRAHVAVFGLGGVGSFAAEAIARAGVGSITLVDKDIVDASNINRQLYALHSTVGQKKVEIAKRRILDINPQAQVFDHMVFYEADTEAQFDMKAYDYVIDAIDTVGAKLLLAQRCYEAGTPLISSMGTGNKLDPCAFEVADISKTSVCPLARVMRRELKKRGIPSLKVVYSKEIPVTHKQEAGDASHRPVPGSMSFVPPVAGMILAGEVIKSIARTEE